MDFGCSLSVVTRDGVRYVGKLVSVDETRETLTLQNVMCMGTENRAVMRKVHKNESRIDSIVFEGANLTDITTVDEVDTKINESIPNTSDGKTKTTECKTKNNENETNIYEYKTNINDRKTNIHGNKTKNNELYTKIDDRKTNITEYKTTNNGQNTKNTDDETKIDDNKTNIYELNNVKNNAKKVNVTNNYLKKNEVRLRDNKINKNDNKSYISDKNEYKNDYNNKSYSKDTERLRNVYNDYKNNINKKFHNHTTNNEINGDKQNNKIANGNCVVVTTVKTNEQVSENPITESKIVSSSTNPKVNDQPKKPKHEIKVTDVTVKTFHHTTKCDTDVNSLIPYLNKCAFEKPIEAEETNNETPFKSSDHFYDELSYEKRPFSDSSRGARRGFRGSPRFRGNFRSRSPYEKRYTPRRKV